jgi:hypothetical protein
MLKPRPSIGRVSPVAASPFRRAVPTTPADQTGALVDCFPIRAAFPVLQAGRHPHLYFRGLLRLHSRYGPSDCSTAQGGLCHEASIQPVASQTARQLPEQSTIPWVEPSSTGDTRPRGALQKSGFPHQLRAIDIVANSWCRSLVQNQTASRGWPDHSARSHRALLGTAHGMYEVRHDRRRRAPPVSPSSHPQRRFEHRRRNHAQVRCDGSIIDRPLRGRPQPAQSDGSDDFRPPGRCGSNLRWHRKI